MKKTIILPIIMIFIIISIASVVLAQKVSGEQKNILTNDKVSSVSEVYKEIEDTNTVSLLSKDELILKAKNFLEKMDISTNTMSKSIQDIQYYDNALDNANEAIIKNDNYIIFTNAKTGDIISYTNNNTNFEKNTLTKDEIDEIAKELFRKLALPDYEQYILSESAKFDDEIWRVTFAKKYEENLLNNGECVKISFAPQTKEIVTLAINRIPYENNTINISEDDAKKIAQKYLEKSVATDMSISINIVRPNHFYSSTNNDNSIYKDVNIMRKAYVCTFNNASSSRVYIDCSTGEVLGGDMLLGGEY